MKEYTYKTYQTARMMELLLEEHGDEVKVSKKLKYSQLPYVVRKNLNLMNLAFDLQEKGYIEFEYVKGYFHVRVKE